MRCVLITPFGAPVEPEVNRIFATDSGFTFANSLSIVEPGLVSRSSATEVGLAPTAARAALYFYASETNVNPGCTSSKMDLSLPKSLGICEDGGGMGASGPPVWRAPSAIGERTILGD